MLVYTLLQPSSSPGISLTRDSSIPHLGPVLSGLRILFSYTRNIWCSYLNLKMNKILEFGRKAMFYVRVLSGYEERRIRNYRLQLEKRLQKAQERKAALSKLPEQAILSEVRRMVEEMQNLNKKLEDTETAIEEYFKPIDKQAEIIMKTQLEGEEKTMRQMAEALQSEAVLKLQKSQEGKTANEPIPEAHHQNKDTESTTQQHGRMR